MPYYETPTLLSFGETTVEVRRFQILVWVRLRSRPFPAILDTGHSHNFLISERHAHDWAEVDSLERIGQIEVNRIVLPQFASDVWIHANQRGTRNPIGALTSPDHARRNHHRSGRNAQFSQTTAVGIESDHLKLVLDGKRREVTLNTGGLF